MQVIYKYGVKPSEFWRNPSEVLPDRNGAHVLILNYNGLCENAIYTATNGFSSCASFVNNIKPKYWAKMPESQDKFL